MNARDDRVFNRTQMLLRGLYNSGLCVMYQDQNLAVRLIENAPPCFPSPATIMSGGDEAIFGREGAADVGAAKVSVLESGEPIRIEALVRSATDETYWFEIDIEPDLEPDDQSSHQPSSSPTPTMVRGLFVSLTDITQIKRREEALRALLYEVSHRSRNLLAIVQSILGHTARHSDTIVSFERKYRGRIASLAHSQDLVTTSNWQGVRFRALAESQLAEYMRPDGVTPELAGDNPILSPNSVLHIGLALHELAANSSTFGAFAHGKGTVRIDTEPAAAGQRLVWTETFETEREIKAHHGFGRAILESVVTRAINGSAEYRITPHQITYQIDWPEPARI